MNYEKYIIDKITEMSGKYTPYQIFSDWIAMSALSIQNQCTLIRDEIYEKRESLYLNIANKYSKDEIRKLCNMNGALALALETKFGDILGEIYMKSGCGSKSTGQFFTPYHISYLTAKLAYENKIKELSGKKLEINEPSCGGGGMIIAVAQVMKENNINYQREMHVVAQDLDWNGVYMTYVQLSLLGIRAIVAQGDTLQNSFKRGYDKLRTLRTPAEMGVIL